MKEFEKCVIFGHFKLKREEETEAREETRESGEEGAHHDGTPTNTNKLTGKDGKANRF